MQDFFHFILKLLKVFFILYEFKINSIDLKLVPKTKSFIFWEKQKAKKMTVKYINNPSFLVNIYT